MDSIAENDGQKAEIPVGSILLFALLAVGGGVVLGGIENLASRLVFVFVFSPLVFGIVALILINKASQMTHVRNRALMFVMGGLMIVIMFAANHYCDYLFFRRDVKEKLANQIAQEYGEADPAIVEQVLDRNILRVTGAPGFLGFMLMEGQRDDTGVISSTTGQKIEVGAGQYSMLIMWLMELALPGVVLYAGVPRMSKKDLYCSFHKRSYSPARHLGGVNADQLASLLERLSLNDYYSVGEMLVDHTSNPSIEVYLRSCENCTSSNPQFKADLIGFKGPRMVTKTVSITAITSLQANDLLQGLSKGRESRAEEQVPGSVGAV